MTDDHEMEPVLYVLMRTDLDSLNPGKAMAQSNHAYGAMKKAVRAHLPLQRVYQKWMQQTEQEFGTTIVLGADQGEIDFCLENAQRYLASKLAFGWVHDPTYPIKDGEVVHLIPLDTCAFIFGRFEDCQEVIGHLEKHS